MLMHNCNTTAIPAHGKQKQQEFKVVWLYSEFKATWGYMKHCLKNETKQKGKIKDEM